MSRDVAAFEAPIMNRRQSLCMREYLEHGTRQRWRATFAVCRSQIEVWQTPGKKARRNTNDGVPVKQDAVTVQRLEPGDFGRELAMVRLPIFCKARGNLNRIRRAAS